ncbi:MAG: DivIVA domain-containing protein [Firmicutes bacterium]|nr:DivIVA domain-containing protein [Bacillota bacterium]
MPLTPLDIHNKEFSKGFRGYDEDEVNEFLDRIVKDYEAIVKENMAMKQKIEEYKDKLEHYTKIEETLHNAIVVAQQTAKEVKETAMSEAELIRKEAERESRRGIEESQVRAKKIQREVEELVKQAHVFRSRFRSLLEAQLEIVNSDDWSEIERFGSLNASEIE